MLLYPGTPIQVVDYEGAEAYYIADCTETDIWVSVRIGDGFWETVVQEGDWEAIDEREMVDD